MKNILLLVLIAYLMTCTLANDPKLEKVEEKPEETTVAPKAAEETTVPPEAPKRCVPQGVWRIVTKYKYSENEEENEEKAFEILIQICNLLTLYGRSYGTFGRDHVLINNTGYLQVNFKFGTLAPHCDAVAPYSGYISQAIPNVFNSYISCWKKCD